MRPSSRRCGSRSCCFAFSSSARSSTASSSAAVQSRMRVSERPRRSTESAAGSTTYPRPGGGAAARRAPSRCTPRGRRGRSCRRRRCSLRSPAARRRRRSRARAFAQPGRSPQDDEVPGRLERDHPAAKRRGELAQPVEVARARQRVDEAALLAPDLDEPELGDVARDRRLHGVEPLVAQRLDDVALRRELPLADEPEDRSLPFELVHVSTSARRDRPVSDLVAGDREWRREPQDGLAGRADEQPGLETGGGDRAGGTIELGPEHQAAAADLEDARQGREPGGEPLALPAHRREERVVERVDDGARSGAHDRVAAERAGVVAGLEAGRRARRRRGARRSAGRSPGPSRARRRPARRRAAPTRRSCRSDPTPHCTSSKTSSAPCSSASARAAARNSALAGWIPPSP